MACSNSNFIQFVDDFYFSALSNEEDEIFPISDEKYADELQLQEAIMSSLFFLLPQTKPSEMVGFSENNEQIHLVSVTEQGESSTIIHMCGICMEPKSHIEIFKNSNCPHRFCTDCIRKHVGTKIQENITMVRCPDISCKSLLNPEFCRSILPIGVFERWVDSLSESAILGSQRFYCPYRDCSALMIDEGYGIIRESECPNCRRLFCAQCKVPWHAGVECHEFQSLKENDIKVMELAKQKAWQRCPKCKFFVEKTDGCLHITCRCGFEFCYKCGSSWMGPHHAH